MEKMKINFDEDIMKEPLKDRQTCIQGQDYPIANIGDQPFEALTYFLFKYSIQLKKEYNYKNVLLIKGGSDHGRDVIAYDNKESKLVIQCKHSDDPKGKHGFSMLASELLKMLLYIYLDKELVHEGNFEYIFVISNNVKPEDVIKLKNFNKEFLDDEVQLKDSIKKLKGKYKAIEKGVKEITNEVLLGVREIGKRMTVNILQNLDIQPLINTIPLEYIEYFFKIKAVEVIKPSLPVITESEVESEIIKKQEEYKSEFFYKALEKISCRSDEKEDALKAFYMALKAPLLLNTLDAIKLEKSLIEYEEVIAKRHRSRRNVYLDKLEDIEEREEEITMKKRKRISREFFSDFKDNRINDIELTGFGKVKDYFSEGTSHHMLNAHKIKEWYLEEEK